jgi:hypothetical protein
VIFHVSPTQTKGTKADAMTRISTHFNALKKTFSSKINKFESISYNHFTFFSQEHIFYALKYASFIRTMSAVCYASNWVISHKTLESFVVSQHQVG